MAAMQAGGKETLQSQLEHLQMKYVGTGHPDISKHEWASNIHRDSYASYLGHHSMLQYFAVAQNESCGRIRHQMIQNMIMPVGLPPVAPDLKLEVSSEHDLSKAK
eukprot:CAMPEP_0177640578 /NCGR_PEP_ID=MMETSP0447-20121125/6617_1 /TAXON_ID=0 /ORGANISM="Stygamoeba regulata, Strain BSH-02190019" /LENGTH=104 /DNA_ID=CAMNT_0019142657 /DNA_START=48 /DNA_END=362 /DNA_ORIENTATION=+